MAWRGAWARGIGVLIGMLALAGAAPGAIAQEGAGPDSAPETLTLLALDAAQPVLLQALAPDATPLPREFVARLELPLEDDPPLPRVYLAIQNTGWSRGVLGWISARLEPEAQYVALELRDLGLAGVTLREDGRAQAFDLVYDAALLPADPDDPAGEAVPGFRLELLTGATTLFRIFRVVEEGGALLMARRNVFTAAGVSQERVQVQIDPQPVFGALLFEVHIEALPVPLPAAAPEVGASGEG